MPFISLNPTWIHDKIMGWLWNQPRYNQALDSIKKKWFRELIEDSIGFILLILCWLIAIAITAAGLLVLVVAINFIVNGEFGIF